MIAMRIELDPKQKRQLVRRAKLSGKSLSRQVRDAVDLYLDMPVTSEDELTMLAREANRSLDRMIKKRDDTIAHIDRSLEITRKGRRVRSVPA